MSGTNIAVNILLKHYVHNNKRKAQVAKQLDDIGCSHAHDSPTHGEVCDKVHYIVGGMLHFSAHNSHLLMLVVATDITCQTQRHDYPMTVMVSETAV